MSFRFTLLSLLGLFLAVSSLQASWLNKSFAIQMQHDGSIKFAYKSTENYGSIITELFLQSEERGSVNTIDQLEQLMIQKCGDHISYRFNNGKIYPPIRLLVATKELVLVNCDLKKNIIVQTLHTQEPKDVQQEVAKFHTRRNSYISFLWAIVGK